MRNSAPGPEGTIRCPLLPGHPPTSLDLSNLGLSSSETGLPRASGRKWSAGRPQPLLFSLQGWAVRWGAQGGSASGRHPGRGFARRKHAERGGRAPPRHKHFCQSAGAAASGSVGRVAGVTHDVTDNDTSRVSHSHTVPELHNVTPGTPCKALTLGHKHPGPSSPAPLPASPGWAGGWWASPAGRLASG